jgi:hypothetical protein
MYDLIALIAMLFAMLTSSIGERLLSRVANNYRDQVRLGVKNGIPLTLKHRWDILAGDWAVVWTIAVGNVAFVGFIFLKLARLSEDEGVRLLGYFGAALHLWGMLMLVLFIPLEAFTLVKHLRALRQAEAD